MYTDERKFYIVAGASLFFAGLAQGAVVQEFLNPRMALSAHLTAVQEGMAIMLAGLILPYTALPGRWRAAAKYGIVFGMVGLWLGLTLSAATGAGEAILPIAGAGFASDPIWETAVLVIVGVTSASMMAGWGVLLTGLIRYRSGN